MGTSYSQLTLHERYQIQALHELQFSARAIARTLKRSNKTVSRELQRLEQRYCAREADRQALYQRASARKAKRFGAWQQDNLDWLLQLDCSPEQIAGRMTLEARDQAVSRSCLYRHIARLGWRERLPRKGKTYRHRAVSSAGVALIPNRTDIDERPDIVDANTELGHWEGDTVHGRDGYLVTLVERVSKLLLTVRVSNRRKSTVSQAICRLLRPYKRFCKTITFDNGGEFAGHEAMARKLDCAIYFAKPYQSWQRGLNENTNGLLRRYFPKGTALGPLKVKEIKRAELLINARPRKALNYLNPLEFLAGRRVSLMLGI